MSAAHRRLAGAISSMALLIAVVGVTPAWAAEAIVLDQDQILYGEEGSTDQLAEIAIEADRVGSTCTLQVHAENQFSVHPGNDLLVTTGGVQTVIEEVEAEPDAGRDLSAQIVLGPTLVVELRFGPHQVSSMGFDLSVDCATTGGLVIGPEPCPDPTTPTTTPTTAPADCPDPEPTPVSEVPFVPPTLPPPCDSSLTGEGGSGGDSSLTVGTDDCGGTTTTAPPAPPATAPPTTAAAAQSTTTTGPSPTVLGLQIERLLPQTPAAAPVQGSPSYTG